MDRKSMAALTTIIGQAKKIKPHDAQHHLWQRLEETLDNRNTKRTPFFIFKPVPAFGVALSIAIMMIFVGSKLYLDKEARALNHYIWELSNGVIYQELGSDLDDPTTILF